MPAERLQKILAAAGHGSRRACEQFIVQGRVRVNGVVARLGVRADAGRDRITLDGAAVTVAEKQYILLNKPRGVVSSLNSQGERRTVRELIDAPGALFPVGRLDVESEGLVLMTNDGELAHRLTHPRFGHEKEYEVLVNRPPRPAELWKWRHGVELDDGQRTAPARVCRMERQPAGRWLRIVMREGRKRQIRRTAQAFGLRVERIRRTRLATLRIGALRAGAWRRLTVDEIAALRRPVSRRRR